MKKLCSMALILVITCLTFADNPFPTFKKTKYIEQVGDKAKERKCDLIFTDEGFRVTDDKHRNDYAVIPYGEVDEIVYEKSSHPRWKTAVFLTIFALLSKGKKHWLTISYKDGDERKYVILKMDKNDYRQIIALSETKTGKEVEWIIED